MPTSYAYFRGSLCDNKLTTISYPDNPPRTLQCQGVTYTRIPAPSGGVLWYASRDWVEAQAEAQGVAGQKDVFRAWHRVMRALHHTARGETNRIRHARHRIRKAVK